MNKVHHALSVMVRPKRWIVGLITFCLGLSAVVWLAQAGTQPVYAAPCTGTGITGTIFRDYNADGTRTVGEFGVPNITVNAYNAAGTLVDSCESVAGGSYGLNVPNGTEVRIEIDTLPTYLQPGAAGADSETTVTFVTSPATGVDISVNNPGDYCQNNPDLVTNCYVTDDQLTGPNNAAPVMVSFPYTATGINPALESPESIANQIGTTYGLAYQRATETLFAAAYIKRLSGLGPGSAGSDGTGTIYAINVNGAPNGTPFIDLDNIFGAGTTGVDPHTDFQVDGDGDFDAGAYPAVGKVGLGDLEISDDDQTLWVVSLANKTLYEINIGSVTATARGIIPAPVCNNGTSRPFALGFKDGLLYVGGVCSAESGGAAADLLAYVYSYNPSTNSFSATPVVQFPLNFDRGCADIFPGTYPSGCLPAEWGPWTDALPAGPYYNDGGFSYAAFPQPMLVDIEFDDGDMILGFRDRFADQIGNDDPGPIESSPSGFNIISMPAGDMLRAGPTGPGAWQIENNSSGPTFGPTAGAGNNQGPGGGEFFFRDNLIGSHDELVFGGLAQVPGDTQITSTAFDPIRAFSAGILQLNNTDGSRIREYEVYPPNFQFAKANGLGDVEAYCAIAPIEIGNRVWHDSIDGDGVQDPGEAPIAGVTVNLYTASGTLVGTDVTDGTGEYIFNASTVPGGVQPNTAYVIRIDDLAPILATVGDPTYVSPANNGSNDLHDSDATNGNVLGLPNGNRPEVSITTGPAGFNNHAYDFGFNSINPTAVTLQGMTATQSVGVAAAILATFLVLGVFTLITLRRRSAR